MTEPQLHVYADGQAVAEAFAAELAGKINNSKESFHLALSGGSTPKLLFRILAEQYADRIDWSKLHLYWGDERMVPHDDPESNFGEVDQLLLDHIEMPASQIHPVPTAISAEQAAKAYGLVIQHSMASHSSSPIFDLVMLGMGGDGHTASIFPDQMELLEDEAICGVATHPESGQQRVTLNGPVINNAREVYFLVTGAGKTDRVAQILNQEAGYEDYPAAHIKPVHGQLHWYLDEAAAAKVDC